MSRARRPTALLRASGSRHYTKAELARREAAEPKLPIPAKVLPPKYLPVTLRPKFDEIAGALTAVGVMSELDGDGLARYLLAEANYVRATSRLTSALNTGDLNDATRLAAMQDRFFRQCRTAGADLGLTVSSRCALVLPPLPEGGEGDDLFGD